MCMGRFEDSFLNEWMKIVGVLCPVYAGCGVF